LVIANVTVGQGPEAGQFSDLPPYSSDLKSEMVGDV
jgi:hypothetical protein